MDVPLKKLLLLLFILSSSAFGQKSPYSVYMDCYTDGDTIPDDGLSVETYNGTTATKMFNLRLLKNGEAQSDAQLNTWEILVYDNKGKFIITKQLSNSPSVSNMGPIIAKGDLMPKKIVIQGITIYVKQNGQMVSTKLPPHTFYRAKTSSKQCAAIQATSLPFNGKLLTGEKSIPLANQKVVLKSKSNVEIQSATTDKYGDFSFTGLKSNENYNLEIKDNPAIKDRVVILAKQDGRIIRSFKGSGNLFVYELLSAEVVTLAKEKEEDTQLAIANFESSANAEITIIQNIYYTPGSSDIQTESFGKLNEIIFAMKKNTSLKLSITSFTDSKGEDDANLVLSQQRAQKVMDYLVAKGVDKGRVTAQGLGETQLRNRCANGVDCSEKEHLLNRRTEFKFTK